MIKYKIFQRNIVAFNKYYKRYNLYNFPSWSCYYSKGEIVTQERELRPSQRTNNNSIISNDIIFTNGKIVNII